MLKRILLICTSMILLFPILGHNQLPESDHCLKCTKVVCSLSQWIFTQTLVLCTSYFTYEHPIWKVQQICWSLYIYLWFLRSDGSQALLYNSKLKQLLIFQSDLETYCYWESMPEAVSWCHATYGSIAALRQVHIATHIEKKDESVLWYCHDTLCPPVDVAACFNSTVHIHWLQLVNVQVIMVTNAFCLGDIRIGLLSYTV